MTLLKLNCKSCMSGKCQQCINENCLCRESHSKTELLQKFDDVASHFIDGFKKDLEFRKILRKTNSLNEFKEICENTVKNDPNLVYQIIFNGLSAFTPNPSHLMIMERTSEGKTYPALQIAQYFPKESVITLASATPQSFKYEHGVLVNSNYESIEDELERFNEQLSSCQDKREHESIKKHIKSILKDSKTLVDLRGKWIIFKEPPNVKLLEMLYSTLSNDEEYSEHKLVNQSSSGKNQSFTIVLRGTPSMLICSARDETTSKRWMETFSRFTIVSPRSSKEKYKAGMSPIGKKIGLPKEIYEENVIDNEKKTRAKKIVQFLIDSLEGSKGEVFNPFIDRLAEVFPHDAGYRWRQRQRFDSLVVMNTLCNAGRRPSVEINQRKIPIVTLEDLTFATEISQESDSLPPHKRIWYREVFLTSWKKNSETIEDLKISKPVLTGTRIKDFIEDSSDAKANVKAIRETFLEPLYEHGYIDKTRDPRIHTRDVYWPVNENEKTKTSLIAIASFDVSCVRACLEKYLKQRFAYAFQNKTITEDELIQNVIAMPDIVPKDGNGVTAFDDDPATNTQQMTLHDTSQEKMQ